MIYYICIYKKSYL